MLCTPDSALELIRKDAGVLRSTVEQLLATSKSLGAAKLFSTEAAGFREDLQHMKLRKVLVKAIQSDKTPKDLRELSVKLLLRMGLVRASAEDLLRAA